MKLALLERLLAARGAGQATVLLSDLVAGTQALLDENASSRAAATEQLALSASDMAAIERAMRDDRCQVIEREGAADLFVEVWNPAPRLFVVGGVHIAQALIPIAATLGYRVQLIDPRNSYAAAGRFPGIDISNGWPDDVLPTVRPDKRSAVVALSHDPKIDDPALIAALKTPAFYIGVLGSRRSHAARVERLLQAGCSPEDVARIHGPVGLAIGAITPGEIAISILGEMTAALRQHPAAVRSPP